MLEGRIQAKKLSEAGYRITVIADAAMSIAVQKSDIVMLGADMYSDNWFLNKIGSYVLALLCSRFKKQLYLLCDSRKYFKEEFQWSMEKDIQPGNEIWASPPKGVSVQNSYFEKVPMEFVHKLITD
jgi:translation initiation factor 2B subunit (eIF-2B alpha/beta/delta family)